jgi:hypothetical protein
MLASARPHSSTDDAAILFVCHSMGDTNVLVETARNMAAKTEENILFLAIGQAAKNILEKLPSDDLLKKSKRVRMENLADIFGEEAMQLVENKALNKAELLKLKKDFLQQHNISKALIGTPSQLDAFAAFQIAEMIVAAVDRDSTFIFNDYFYKEPAHAYWKVLEEKDEKNDWRQKVTWLAPLDKTKEKILQANPTVSVHVAGHPAIDAALAHKPPAAEVIGAFRKGLGLDDRQALLFISGTKDLQDDRALLEEILKSLARQEHPEAIQVRLGLHPGNQELNNYIAGVFALLESEQYAKVAGDVKLIIPDSLVLRMDSDLLHNSHVIRMNITGDQAALAAHGVASAVPSTLVNQTAIAGRPAYYHQEKEPYLPADRLSVGKHNMGFFLDKIAAKKQQDVITRKELGLSDASAAAVIAHALLKR